MCSERPTDRRSPLCVFTKHLQSNERLDSLVKIFNCEYRDGRPDSAPLLRGSAVPLPGKLENDVSTDDDGGEIGAVDHLPPLKDDDEDYGAGVPEAELHDVDLLPHLHSRNEIDRLFPLANFLAAAAS